MTIQELTASQLKQNLPDIKPGDTVRVHQRIKEGSKERIQVFEGVVLARKHGNGINATMTVRKMSQSIAVERIFPIHSPVIVKIEVTKRSKVRRAKLYYLREAKGKKGRLRTTALDPEKGKTGEAVAEAPQPEEPQEPTPEEQTEIPNEEPAPKTAPEETPVPEEAPIPEETPEEPKK